MSLQLIASADGGFERAEAAHIEAYARLFGPSRIWAASSGPETRSAFPVGYTAEQGARLYLDVGVMPQVGRIA